MITKFFRAECRDNNFDCYDFATKIEASVYALCNETSEFYQFYVEEISIDDLDEQEDIDYYRNDNNLCKELRKEDNSLNKDLMKEMLSAKIDQTKLDLSRMEKILKALE